MITSVLVRQGPGEDARVAGGDDQDAVSGAARVEHLPQRPGRENGRPAASRRHGEPWGAPWEVSATTRMSSSPDRWRRRRAGWRWRAPRGSPARPAWCCSGRWCGPRPFNPAARTCAAPFAFALEDALPAEQPGGKRWPHRSGPAPGPRASGPTRLSSTRGRRKLPPAGVGGEPQFHQAAWASIRLVSRAVRMTPPTEAPEYDPIRLNRIMLLIPLLLPQNSKNRCPLRILLSIQSRKCAPARVRKTREPGRARHLQAEGGCHHRRAIDERR